MALWLTYQNTETHIALEQGHHIEEEYGIEGIYLRVSNGIGLYINCKDKEIRAKG